MASTPVEILKKYWGYDSFRESQSEIIHSALEGKDTLALLPTGGGKSICFQVPALAMEGLCLVISPLIALMKDQVFNLKRRKIPAEAIHSGMHFKEIDRILDLCVQGEVKLLYLSPERLGTRIIKERITRMPVNLLAIDEAHCISQWGYDFRPAYLKINELRALLPGTPVLALTATATPEVVIDIQEKLSFRKQHVIQKSFARNNLAYVVLQEEAKLEKMADILKKVPGSGVVYVRNRKKTRQAASYLHSKGIAANYFHAGLTESEKNSRQEQWIQGKIRVIVSTNAFGMGIDKPDVRTVIHLDLPDSLEAYFQEAGRAGRDGKKSYAILLYSQEDRAALERNYELSFPDVKFIRQVWHALGSYFQLATGSKPAESLDFDFKTFIENFKLNSLHTYYALKELEREGWLSMTEAVFIPSTLKIIVNKDQLYDYQLRNKKFDPILKTVLRAYQGAFHVPVYLREENLVKALNMRQADLRAAFHRMHQSGIIEYRPQKELPQIQFLRERIGKDHLVLDTEAIYFRKERYRKRMIDAINYAENQTCRSQTLLAYFGEKTSPTCGICDVCLERHQTEPTQAEFTLIREKLLAELQNQPTSIRILLATIEPRLKNKAMNVLEYLIDEGALKKEGDIISLPG